jgi:hypothetical protein
MALNTGSAVILGRREFVSAMKNLPGRVVKKIMDAWVFKQAQRTARIAKRLAPRDRRKPRRKPESARLWRAIRASRVRRVKSFPNTISRAIAYGATSTRSSRLTRQSSGRTPGRARKSRKAAQMTVLAPRAAHFHLVVLGTRQRKTRAGANRGMMWGRKQNPHFWEKATAQGTSYAQGEVGAQLRDAYDRGIQAEINRLNRKYL